VNGQEGQRASGPVRSERLAALVERVAAADPERPALAAPGRPALAYGALHGLLGSAVAGLRLRGVGPSDRVALVVENGPEAATAFLALAAAAVCAPLNPSYRRRELDFFLDDLRAGAVVVSSSLDSPVREAAAARGIPALELTPDLAAPAGVFRLGTPTDVSVRDMAGSDPAASDMSRGLSPRHVATGRGRCGPVSDGGGVALLLHTSGTTSRPKLVPLTHRNLLASARNVARTLELGPADRCLNVMPLFHIHGLVAALLASLEAGGSVACTPGFHPIRVFDWLRELDPTWTTAVPTMHQSLLARAAVHEDVLRSHRLRFVRSSSAALPGPVAEQLERAFGVPVIEAYGMTEAAHQMASNPLPPASRRPGSVGPAGGPEIAILSPAGEPLPAGSTGEVAIRGENVFAGYEGDPEANAAAFSGGWFRTGDEGMLDESGYLTLSGRIKEQINRGGEKVSPLEVDERLLAHPAVAEAVTFAVPDERLGEEVAAAVVLAPGARADEPALQDFVARTLAPFKVPRRIVQVDELPKGPTGKLQRVGLAERLGVSTAARQPAAGEEFHTTFERLLAAIWADVLGVGGIGRNDDFFALGGDSILGAEAVARIRELTGDDGLPLVSIVRAPTPAAMARELDRGVSALGRSGAVALRPGAEGPPFFFVHGGDGEVLELVALARAFGDGRAFYGLRARGIDDGEEPHGSIGEIAEAYAGAMRSVQPSGPYALGGFCLGGTIALELAGRLEAVGETVSDLVLVDPRLPRPHDLRHRLWLVPRRLRERRLLRSVRRVGARDAWDPGEGAGSAVEATFARLREAHRVTRYGGPAVAVLGADYGRHELPDWHLRRLVPRVRIVRVGHTHSRLLRPPGVDVLAGELRRALGLPGEPA
jgi:oxalate---CoA ligase